MQISMPHLKQLLADLVVITILQITGISLEVNIKIQLAGLAGSMLAVRTIDGKQDFWTWVKVAFSGLVVANYTGLFWCEIEQIPLNSFKALFLVFALGFLSDIIIRGGKMFGQTAVSYVPKLVQTVYESIKSYIPKKS